MCQDFDFPRMHQLLYREVEKRVNAVSCADCHVTVAGVTGVRACDTHHFQCHVTVAGVRTCDTQDNNESTGQWDAVSPNLLVKIISSVVRNAAMTGTQASFLLDFNSFFPCQEVTATRK